MDVVDTLNTQHRLLEQVAGEMNRALQAEDRPAIAETLKRFHDILDAHLKLEHSHFYPPMLELASKPGNEPRLATVKLFAENMKLIASGLGTFFTRYVGKTDFDLAALRKDWSSSLSILVDRMGAEEKTLHPLYVQLKTRAEQGH